MRLRSYAYRSRSMESQQIVGCGHRSRDSYLGPFSYRDGATCRK